MREHNDILLTEDLDLAHQDGDLVTGDVIIQQQAVLLTVGEGGFKQYPTTGIGAHIYLNDEDEAALIRKTRTQFRLDGLITNTLRKVQDKLEISASHA